MKERYVFVLDTNDARQRAAEIILRCPDGYQVQLEPVNLTKLQDARLWGMLADISKQVKWHGRYLSAYEWRALFGAAMFKPTVLIGLDEEFVAMQKDLSGLSSAQKYDLLMFIEAFGSDRGVTFNDMSSDDDDEGESTDEESPA